VKSDPWHKTTFHLRSLGADLALAVPHDLFSTMRIDEGTLLLLEHLPESEPASVLDMGCGYGALGLPVAARFPRARVELVDRDLLAVAASSRNAAENRLDNVRTRGSLGFRDLPAEPVAYDWILCNVPARIGTPFIEDLLGSGRLLLAAGGELRVVVINALIPVLEQLREKNGWPLVERARGPRHSIFSLAAGGTASAAPADLERLYARDRVELGGLKLQRPFDLGGDDPRRLTSGLPVLIDVLPRQAPRSVLCFRCGYGALPLLARARWPEARVVAVDRDLLATTFTRINAAELGLAGERLDVRENAHLPDALQPDERFELVVGELSPSAGERVAEAELEAIATHLEKGGQALLLSLEKLEREWVRPFALKKKLSIHPLIAREGYAALRMAGPA
jgi:16S rRNA G1207 methylase RsmC